MLAEVSQAILPLALRTLTRRGDLERTALLIESLARHWRDSVAFKLLIVSPGRDVDLLRKSLPRQRNIEVSVRPESDFFRPYSSFWLLPGWYRQQLIKLKVPALLGFGGYLTLDSDVCCVGDFNAETFVQDGRALSRWEPKPHHQWWRQAAECLGVPYDGQTHGLSVTPNILHGELARQTLDCLRVGWVDAVTTLGLRTVTRIGSIAWTEYSLYTSAAELKGNLFDFHVHWDPSYHHATQLFSERSCVWAADDFERLTKLPSGSQAGGKFIIVQSHARIPLEQVRDYCLSFAG